ncbi:hypothetical protein E2320_003279, partial [Naja naja]
MMLTGCKTGSRPVASLFSFTACLESGWPETAGTVAYGGISWESMHLTSREQRPVRLEAERE